MCILYRIYHGECSGELFDLVPAAEFSYLTVRHRHNHHPYHLVTWHSTTARFRRNFLPPPKSYYNIEFFLYSYSYLNTKCNRP